MLFHADIKRTSTSNSHIKIPLLFFFFYELKFLNLYIFKIDPAFCMGKMQTGLHLIIIYLYEIAFLKQ